MITYVIYLHDRRYSVPSMEWLVADDDDRALELTRRRLESSNNYFAAEVWEGDRLVARLD